MRDSSGHSDCLLAVKIQRSSTTWPGGWTEWTALGRAPSLSRVSNAAGKRGKREASKQARGKVARCAHILFSNKARGRHWVASLLSLHSARAAAPCCMAEIRSVPSQIAPCSGLGEFLVDVDATRRWQREAPASATVLCGRQRYPACGRSARSHRSSTSVVEHLSCRRPTQCSRKNTTARE